MRRVSLVLVMVLSACGDTPPAPVPPVVAVAPRPVVATLSGLKGAVTVTRDGATAAAVAGSLFEGDTVRTGADGHALLTSRSTEVELLENSSFTLGKSLTDLALATGELFFEEADGGTFSTGTGSAQTQAGSRVKLDARDGGTAFVVGLGTLDFVEFDGGVSTVKEGGRFVVGQGELQFDDTPVEPPAPEAKPVVRLTPKGTVLLKGKTGPTAKVPAAGRDLDEAATLNVDRSAQLVAIRGGATLVYEGGAKGTLEPTTEDPSLRTTLQAGGLRIFLKAGESVLLQGKVPITLRAKKPMTAVVTPSRTGPRVEVLSGEGDVAAPDGAAKPVQPGEAVSAKGKALDVSRRGTPLLVLPAGRTTRVFWGRPADVGLQFAPGDAPVEIATDAAFENVVVRGSAAEQVVVPAPLKGQLFWRREGEAEASGARFDRDEFAGPVQARSDTVAETGLKATVYFQSAVPALTFTFPQEDGITSWHFLIFRAGEAKPLVERKVTENRVLVESGVLGEGSYSWKAIPIEKNGRDRDGQRYNKMDVVFDNSLTRLVLNAPREGERATQATGIAPLGSKLTLNGKPVAVDAAGRFSVPTGTAPVLIMRLFTPGAGEAIWVRRQQ